MVGNLTCSSWIPYFLAVSSLLFCHSFFSTVRAQNSPGTKNELSLTIQRVRGGWEPMNFFDGNSVGVSYNREVIPYIHIHSEISFTQLLLADEGEGRYYADRHFNNMVISDIGIELIPISANWFQLRFGFAGSLQYRQTSDGMDPEKKTGNQIGEKVYFFNFSTVHSGYKFELKTPVLLSTQFFLAPVASMRSYPNGKYDIPRSFELGIQGGYRF